MGLSNRVESDLEVGAGYFDVFSASGNLKELLGKKDANMDLLLLKKNHL